MRRLFSTAGLGAGILALSSCGLLGGGVYEMPLPGGADLGDDPISISADFEDALDLVPQSTVKVDNVPVGRVSKITLNDDGHSAHVELKVNDDVDLPGGTSARLRQTSLLGEKYVELVRPVASPGGPSLTDGDNLGLAQTSQAAEVEQVLGALSLVLNGGGIAQFQEISRELQNVSTGRPGEIKAFLGQMEEFVTGLESRKGSITAAIDGLADLSETLEGDKEKISTALTELSPGMKVIVDQRAQLTAMLSSLDKLSTVTVSTLDAAQDDIVADFKVLAPILEQLAKAGSDLPNSLQMLLTYPFPDSVLGAIKGDYLNVFITTNFRTLPNDCKVKGCTWPQPTAAIPGTSMRRGAIPAPTLLPPTSSPAPGMIESSLTVPSPSTSPSSKPSVKPSEKPSATPSSGGASPKPSDSTSTTAPAAPQGSASSSPTAPAPTQNGRDER
ncbi:phospholipid/cholesterol/gamma-HCH transport system substrate-binding protein [Nocardioides daedukensis]|uniref:Phospholipid/cholesterol/gamma-HCH transport system substrate-binding protein n=1 Tax=Nocardioides daedukensis TaxID=634462 RepID=A0A7Y9UPW1_9ACTN|nr:MCE family protein [Nocardioides daedukensis]NYG60028.1 phospholipid/cholesterol/gamma-HCH transport system substrate-binding protein [Nocardioides daedukensis]